MKNPIKDTVFVRLFLLLFFVLYISSYVSREIVDNLGLAAAKTPYDPFSLRIFIFRIISAALTAWVAASWLSKPIKRMTMAAAELGKNPTSLAIDETIGSSEVRQASKVFNQMQARIKQQLVDRDRFLAAVSHDLRTPLTRLKLRAEKIKPPDLCADVQHDIDEMTAIIDTTLDYLRGDQSEATCLFDIDALIHSMAEDAAESGNVVTVAGYAHPLMLQPLAIRRCMNNLIGNALRYGERADVAICETANEVIITISDHGHGIPEDQLEAVFSPFYRLEGSRNLHTGGLGLGLSIALDMAKKQGGHITLKNAPQGGLVATLSLPKPYPDD